MHRLTYYPYPAFEDMVLSLLCDVSEILSELKKQPRATIRSPWTNRPCHAEASRPWSLARRLVVQLIVGRYNTHADIGLTPIGNATHDPSWPVTSSQGIFIFSLIFLLFNCPMCGGSMIEPGWDTPCCVSGGSSGSKSISLAVFGLGSR
jgi:hypothetical protein